MSTVSQNQAEMSRFSNCIAAVSLRPNDPAHLHRPVGELHVKENRHAAGVRYGVWFGTVHSAKCGYLLGSNGSADLCAHSRSLPSLHRRNTNVLSTMTSSPLAFVKYTFPIVMAMSP